MPLVAYTGPDIVIADVADRAYRIPDIIPDRIPDRIPHIDPDRVADIVTHVRRRSWRTLPNLCYLSLLILIFFDVHSPPAPLEPDTRPVHLAVTYVPVFSAGVLSNRPARWWCLECLNLPLIIIAMTFVRVIAITPRHTQTPTKYPAST